MKRAARIIRRLLDVALIALVITVVVIALAANIGPRLGHDLVVIRSGSMEPTIPTGALVDIVRVSPSDLRAGDIVTLEASSDVLDVHRITGVIQLPYGVYVQTKSDANRDPDPTLTPVSTVVGRVDFSVPGLGYLMYMLTIPAGILSVFGLAVTMLLTIWLLRETEKVEKAHEEPVPWEMPGLAGLTPPTSEVPPQTDDWIG